MYRIDPKTGRIIVTDLTPSIRGKLSTLTSFDEDITAIVDEQEDKIFILNRVIKALLRTLWEDIDWNEVDLSDINWEEWEL